MRPLKVSARAFLSAEVTLIPGGPSLPILNAYSLPALLVGAHATSVDGETGRPLTCHAGRGCSEGAHGLVLGVDAPDFSHRPRHRAFHVSGAHVPREHVRNDKPG